MCRSPKVYISNEVFRSGGVTKPSGSSDRREGERHHLPLRVSLWLTVFRLLLQTPAGISITAVCCGVSTYLAFSILFMSHFLPLVQGQKAWEGNVVFFTCDSLVTLCEMSELEIWCEEIRGNKKLHLDFLSVKQN